MNDMIQQQLENLAVSSDFSSHLEQLTAEWSISAPNLDTIETILQFMENHPTLDFGMPGPLVHFMEKFYHTGYEHKLMESVRRKPTTHTTWMVNRILNGSNSAPERQTFIDLLKESQTHPLADTDTLQYIQRFLARL